MGNCLEKEDEFEISCYRKQRELIVPIFLEEDDTDNINKYVKQDVINFYDIDNVLDKENKEDLICPICFYILKEPKSCSEKKMLILFVKNV